MVKNMGHSFFFILMTILLFSNVVVSDTYKDCMDKCLICRPVTPYCIDVCKHICTPEIIEKKSTEEVNCNISCALDHCAHLQDVKAKQVCIEECKSKSCNL
ncbi:hypothetical protein Leryth_027623 [Lithospermum erythrorhizon]|nr:hypothetical protein Leryth_027623 [Lithospermum erythrorhizon]